MFLRLVCFSFLLLCSFQGFSQESSDTQVLKIYLDCNVCDHTYMKQNLGNVQFVRDQNFSDVHLFFITQSNGSGGRQYKIEFIGKDSFGNISYDLEFSTDTNMTSDDIRKRILKHIKLGLVRFWIEKGDIDAVTVSVPSPENEEEKVEEKDPWNYWVFRAGANGWFNGQESSKSSNINFNMSAKRVTEKNKFSLRTSFRENINTFTFDGSDIVSITNSKSINIYDVVSLNEHWSVGAFANMGASIFSNKKFYWSLKPAIEYNFFDYEESAKKQLVLSYKNGIVHNQYYERSVFGENKEYLFEHGLTIGGSVKQEWGNVFADASFNQYLHDTTLNALSFYVGTSIRVFKGFNVNLSGNYRITRNQVNLPAGDVSLEELLLQQQQLQSGYNYFVSVGLSYSFGSIYNTIVNPRFNF